MARVLWDCCDGFIAVGTGVGDELWHKAGGNLALSLSEPQSWCEHWGSAERGTGNRWEMRFPRMPQISESFQPCPTPGRSGAALSWCSYTGVQGQNQNRDSEFPGNKLNTRSIFLLLWGFERKKKVKIVTLYFCIRERGDHERWLRAARGGPCWLGGSPGSSGDSAGAAPPR